MGVTTLIISDVTEGSEAAIIPDASPHWTFSLSSLYSEEVVKTLRLKITWRGKEDNPSGLHESTGTRQR